MSIAATLFFWVTAYVTAALAAPAIAQTACDNEFGAGFVQTTMRFPDDYDGKVTSTVVRNEPPRVNATC